MTLVSASHQLRILDAKICTVAVVGLGKRVKVHAESSSIIRVT